MNSTGSSGVSLGKMEKYPLCTDVAVNSLRNADIGGYPLHQSVFANDVKAVSKLIRMVPVSEQDCHGNTPLHLAVMLGHRDCVHLLLAHNAQVKLKNVNGWTPLAEAISYGDRLVILSLLRKLKQQSREQLEERRPILIEGLEKLQDFTLTLRWDFQSWVPLVSRILPSDICRIRKRGARIRMDTTLVDFNDMHWERGDITFLFDGRRSPSESLYVLDNKLKVFQRIRYEETETELEEEVDLLMSNDIVTAFLSSKSVSFTRAQRGWFFREDKTERIGNFESDFYTANGIFLNQRKRREHLTEDDLQRNKQIMQSLTKGHMMENVDSMRRESLNPPQKPAVSWVEYISSLPGEHPILGRSHMSKDNVKHFKANVACSEDFPMSVEGLLDVLEVIAPFKHFNKLREFMVNKLPPGFPVKVEMPVFPTISARITFEDFQYTEDLSPNLFKIPRSYKENPTRFPDL